ncbi:MAG: hypothetical protein R3E66_08740 [bacterium]
MEKEQIISVLRAGGYLLPGTQTPSDVAVDTMVRACLSTPLFRIEKWFG